MKKLKHIRLFEDNQKSKLLTNILSVVHDGVVNSDNFNEFSKYVNSQIIKLSGSNKLYGRELQEDAERFLSFVLDPNNRHDLGKRQVLYHGSPDKIDKFKLVTGWRNSGVFGGMREIDNLGIFLTDNKRLAEFFGQNRAEGVKNTGRFELYTLLVDTGRILYMDNLPSQQKRLANELLYNYHGSRQRLSPQNYWWLLDKPEFIDSIRKKYDTVVFNEKPKIMKMAGVNYGKTFFVMDPDRIEIYKPLRFLELKDNIDFYLSEYVYYLDRTK